MSADNVNYILIASQTNQEFTTTAVLAGEYYWFRARATNLYGSGPYSTAYQFKAAKEPEPVTVALTTNQDTDIVITWYYPDDNADTILQYLV
jgi:predicted phage tail protein